MAIDKELKNEFEMTKQRVLKKVRNYCYSITVFIESQM